MIQIDEVVLDRLPPQRPAVPPCSHTPPEACNDCWNQYPQSLFPNWTKPQQLKSRIGRIIEGRQSGPCNLYRVDVLESGEFGPAAAHIVEKGTQEHFWDTIMQGRVRILPAC